MAKRKTPIKRKTTTPAKTKRRTAAPRKRASSGGFVNFFVPLFFILSILFCLGFLSFMGYRTVTASSFFDVKAIEVRGIERVSREQIEKIVRVEAEKSGVWNADLNEIRKNIESLVHVKSVTVSRVLPNGLRINVVERQPKAVVRIDGGDYWADEDAVIINEVGKNDVRPPFVLHGWDREKTEKARTDNQERVRLYQKMLEDWQEFEVAKRVSFVDLTDLREPKAFVRDSGKLVRISLEPDNLRERLHKSIKAVAGKGDTYDAVSLNGQNFILSPRKSM